VPAINDSFAGDISAADVREALGRTGLCAQALTPHLDRREFQQGSLTNPDPTLRQKAFDLGKQTRAIAHALDAQYVKFWSGQAGFELAGNRQHRALRSLNEEERHGPC
jgi:xylose isomerase